jgi:hypothetical protein
MNGSTGVSKNRDHKKFLRSMSADTKRDSVARPTKFIKEVMSSPEYKKGALTKQAHMYGYPSALPFAKHVLEHPHEYDMTTRHRAQFLANIQKK